MKDKLNQSELDDVIVKNVLHKDDVNKTNDIYNVLFSNRKNKFTNTISCLQSIVNNGLKQKLFDFYK